MINPHLDSPRPFIYSSPKESIGKKMIMGNFNRAILTLALLFFAGAVAIAAEAKRPAEWDKAVEEAKKEGKIVLINLDRLVGLASRRPLVSEKVT
jgi:hypothetical protein